MSELHIFTLLRQLNNDFASNPTDCDNLLPEHIKSASKSIADIIYETLRDKSSTGTSKRLDFIQLIRRLSHKDKRHCQPNDANRATFLNCIAPLNEEPDLLTKTLNEELRGCDVEVDTKIIEFYRRRDDKLNERRERLERIAQVNEEHLREINVTTPKNVHVGFEAFANDLCRDESNRPDNFRRDRVKLLCAVLNVERGEDERRARGMLEEIARGETSKEEVVLIESLWRGDVSIVEMDKFRFLYEKPLLRICTELVVATDLKDRLSIVEGFKRENENMFRICGENRPVRNDVLEMLYSLFALSGYNENLFCIIKCF